MEALFAGEHGAALSQALLPCLQPAELCALSSASRALLAYCRQEWLWRAHALRAAPLATLLDAAGTGADATWRAAYVRCRHGHDVGAPRSGSLSPPPPPPPPPPVWLVEQRQRATLVAASCTPHHLPAELLGLAPSEAATWASAPAMVPQESAPQLSCRRFRAEFEAPGLPVVITGLLTSWRAFREWAPDALAARAGESPHFSLAHRVGEHFGVELELTASLPTYVRYMRSPLAASDELPLYVFEPRFGELAPQLLRDYDVPSLRLFPEDLLAGLGRTHRPSFRWLVVGGPRSGTPWHWDPASTHAWNALLHGTKRWFLFPPGWPVPGVAVERDAGGRPVAFRAPLSPAQWLLEVYPHLPMAARPLELLQRAGETVFVPSRWWHMVLNLSETVSVTQNYVSAIEPRDPQLQPHPQQCESSVPAPLLTGNLLDVFSDLAVMSRQHEPASAAAAAADAAKSGGAPAPMTASNGAAPVRRARTPLGPDPDAHGLTFAPAGSAASAQRALLQLPQHEALRSAALAVAPGPPHSECDTPQRHRLLRDAFTLAGWHLRERQALSAALLPLQDAAPPFASHAHLMAAFGDARLFAPVLQVIMAACCRQFAPGAVWREDATALTSRTNPAFLLRATVAARESDSSSDAARCGAVVAKLFSPFVCEDGGQQFQPAAAWAAYEVEVAVLAHWQQQRQQQRGERPATPALQLAELLCSGVARDADDAAPPVWDAFSPPAVSAPVTQPLDSSGRTATRSGDGVPSESLTWVPRSVSLTADGLWRWPFLVTRFLDDGHVSLAAARSVFAAAAGRSCATEEAAASKVDAWHARVAVALAPLVHQLHTSCAPSPGGDGASTHALAVRIVAASARLGYAARAGDALARSPAHQLHSAVRLEYPPWAPVDPGSPPPARGVLLPLCWAPYLSRLIALRLSGVARRMRARRLPLHLLAQVAAFLPPLHLTHVLLPLRVHPAHLQLDASGFVDLASPGVLPAPVLLHGDLTGDNIYGRGGAGGGAAWAPTTFIDLADASLGDPLWEACAVLCSALGGDLQALGCFARAYDDAARLTGAHGAASPPCLLAADPSAGYRLLCLLLLHPVDGCHLLRCLQPAHPSGAAAGLEVAAAAAAPALELGSGAPGQSVAVDLLEGLRGLPASWASVAALVTAAQARVPA